MNKLPDEIICSIFKYTIKNQVNQLFTLQCVCKRFQRLSNNAYLWYYAFRETYPKWAINIKYAYDKQPLVNWKQCMTQLLKEKRNISTHIELESILSKNKHNEHIKPSYCINGFQSNIDKTTNTGIIGISKHGNQSRHKILFYTWPEYKLIRKLSFQFMIDDDFQWACQIIGLQTIDKTTLFAVALTQPFNSDDDEEHISTSTWRNIIIYTLDVESGHTICLANIELSSFNLLGRGAWFFNTLKDINSWLQFVSPDIKYDQNYSAFLLLYGVSLNQFHGSCQVLHFDTRENHTLLDPSQTLYQYNQDDNSFEMANKLPFIESTYDASIISVINLEARVSCIEHFSFASELNHLICTGNFHSEELSIYDWRFDIKVGILPSDIVSRFQPWGIEFSFAVQPPPNAINLVNYGPRLIVVCDRQDRFQIKVWDISKLFHVQWNPFYNNDQLSNGKEEDDYNIMMSRKYTWWDKRTSTLEKLALELYDGNIDHLPYTSSGDPHIVHIFNDMEKDITAYVVLNTRLFLINNDNSLLVVLDIETGQVLSTTVICDKMTSTLEDDVNVVGDKHVIITRKHHLLKCNLS